MHSLKLPKDGELKKMYLFTFLKMASVFSVGYVLHSCSVSTVYIIMKKISVPQLQLKKHKGS